MLMLADCHCCTPAGVAVSVSGVGERIMAASLARAAGMQLQLQRQQALEPLLTQLLQTQLLSQPGPWDAGVLALRVVRSAGDDCSSSQMSTSGSQPSSSPAAGGGGGGAGRCQQEQGAAADVERLRVELVAAFTSHSFAIGYAAAGMQPQVHVLRRPAVGDGAAVKCLAFSCNWPAS